MVMICRSIENNEKILKHADRLKDEGIEELLIT
jgi:hypothetical protein